MNPFLAHILNTTARVGLATVDGRARMQPTNTKGKGKRRQERCTPCEAIKRKQKARKFTGLG